ncbi:MAG TPA: ABC transporter ATP-binding protein [Burkholderiales bacterium]|jgi:branched-chain amino acid transport system ATP-binding protein|nr:ABC transporter ATP-binding protein [Burkholderiales bacterium]
MTSPALQLSDVRKSFGRTSIINGVNLAIARGERHAIIGPNGAGKSTLFNLISGRFPVSSGRIDLRGEDITGLEPHLINRKGLARSFQITNIFPRLSVYENLRCAVLWSLGYKYSFWHRIGALKEVRCRTDEIVERIGMATRRDRPAGVLTYAEQRALEIGVTIAGGADVILLDEPTAGMSRSETDAAMELIRNVTEGKTLVMVEHDMSVVFNLADRISVLVYGEVIASGTPQEIRGNKAVQEAYLGTEQT